MKNKIKDAFSLIEPSKNIDEKILNSIKNQNIKKEYKLKKNYFFKRLSYAIVILTFMIITGVFAKEIIKNYFFTKTTSNGVKSEVLSLAGQVKSNTESSIKCTDKLTINKIEKELNVNFLIDSNNDIIDCTINRNKNNKIESVHLYLTNVSIGNLNPMNVGISFMTQDASKETIESFKESAGIKHNITANKDDSDLIENRYSKKLNTDIYLIKDYGLDSPYRTPFFVYENILYNLFPSFATSDEIIEAIDSLK